MKKATLAVIIKDWKILLAMKKRGFWEWKLNWPGGKLEKNETPQQAMIREAYEELKIKIKRQGLIWKINFYFKNKPERNLEGYIFYVDDFEWTPQETEEMKPYWFDLNKIPYDKMWEDDKIWLPKAIKKEKFKYNFYFDENQKLIKIENFDFKT